MAPLFTGSLLADLNLRVQPGVVFLSILIRFDLLRVGCEEH
jgi:hypothetical protein